MTTKTQERKALEQIKKIVESLGADSYIATAFEGCFEIAESNIENDWACSMKQRAESSENRCAEAEKRAKYLEDALKKAAETNAKLTKTIEINHDNAMSEIRDLEEQLKVARSKALDPWLYKEIWLHYDNLVDECKERNAELADQMADLAEDPEMPAFKETVTLYRFGKEKRETCERIVRALELIAPEGI